MRVITLIREHKLDTAMVVLTIFNFMLLATLIIGRPEAAAQPSLTCPAGSYEIGRENGKPICKLEPTGCLYGDSIPMDVCGKFAPKDVQPTTTEPVAEPEPAPAEYFEGK